MNVYRISANQNCYSGEAFVGANTAEEANDHIRYFKECDKNNFSNSWGYSYVTEDDIEPHLFTDINGIITYGIWYSG